jgi:hypothetical protein
MFAALNSFLTRAVTGYFLNKSLRFRSSASAYLNRTPAVAGSQTTWTWSGWVKRGTLGSALQQIFGVANGGNDANYLTLFFQSDTLGFTQWNSPTLYRVTTQVFRDPAAWYHIVLVLDTTQATAANRILVYVNGTAITSFSSNLNPAQNATLPINGAVVHQMGRDAFTSGSINFDGEMAEINFVDGQALAPTAFGASSIYNQWLPIKYAGTYGTNGFYLPFSGGTATSYAGSFNGSTQYLTVPNDAAFTLGATSTTEAWIYLTSATGNKRIVTNGSNTNSFDVGIFGTTNTVFVAGANANTTTAISLNTWTHVAVVFNAGTLTIYFNGVSQSLTGTTTGYSLVASTLSAVFIGAQNASSYFPGYISNLRVVKGTAVYTANFIPPTAALTAVSGTSLLTLQNATIVDNSINAFTITNVGTVVTSVQSPFLNTTVLTADSSGNGNNWTPNNISLTAGSTYDSLTDVPTLTSTTVANYCVINPLSPTLNSGTISNGNLKNAGAFGGSGCIAYGTIGVTSGKFYFEVESVSNAGHGQVALGIYTNNSGLVKYSGDGGDTGYTTYGTYGVAFDVDAGKLWYRNTSGSWVSGDPATGASPTSTFTVNLITFPYSGTSRTSGFNENGIGNWNFGQQPFVYTAPSGFLPLNTFNI